MPPIQLVDPQSGQIYLADNDQTAQAQMSAYGLQVATPDQIAAYDKTKDAGTPGDIPPDQAQPVVGNAPPPAVTPPGASPVPSVAAGVPITPGPQPVAGTPPTGPVQSEPIAQMSPNVPAEGTIAGTVGKAAPSASASEVAGPGAPPPDQAKQPIQLIDRKTGQIYLAPDREGAIAQMRAYDLDIATPAEISWFDKNQRRGGLLEQAKTFPETVAAATAKGVAFLEQPVFGTNPELGEPLKPEELAPFAFTEAAKERREVNKKTALVASAVPDVVATTLIPGEGLIPLLGRAVSSGIWGEAGAAATDEKPFDPMDALIFGAGAGAFEGGLHVIGGGIRALGGRAYDALGTAVERARNAALGGIAEQGTERMATLAENAETLFAQHQATLDAAMDTIDQRMGQAPEKMFTPGVLRKTVSDNVEAQADHFIGIAGQVSAAAEVTGNAELKSAADSLRNALGSSNGAKMYAALRDARIAMGDAVLDNPLLRDAVQAMDESLKNESIWGKAAKNYSTVAETANEANAVGRHDIRDLTSRGPLESRLEQARNMATATGDKQLSKAISAAKKALQDADEVHGAVLMGQGQGLLGKFGKKAGEFGDKAGAFAIDNIVQNALLAASAGAGHIIGGFPGAAAGYLLGRGAYVMYGDKITAAVWQAMKREIAAKAAQNIGRTAATAAGVVGGGVVGGVPGAVAGAYAANKGASAAERWVKNVVSSVKESVSAKVAARDAAATEAAAAGAKQAGTAAEAGAEEASGRAARAAPEARTAAEASASEAAGSAATEAASHQTLKSIQTVDGVLEAQPPSVAKTMEFEGTAIPGRGPRQLPAAEGSGAQRLKEGIPETEGELLEPEAKPQAAEESVSAGLPQRRTALPEGEGEGEGEKLLGAGKFAEVAQQAAHAMPFGEKMAVAQFTKDGAILNAGLRGSAQLPAFMARSMEQRAVTLDHALTSAVEKGHAIQGTVYRGVSMAPAMIDALEPGVIITDKGFLSGTTSEALAGEYAKARAGQLAGSPVVFEIQAKSAVPAFTGPGLNAATDRVDVLFPRATGLRVTEVSQEGGRWLVRAEEIPAAELKAKPDILSTAKKVVAVAGFGAAGMALATQDEKDRNGFAPAAASVGLLALFLPRMGRRVFEESLHEALSGLTARERVLVRSATMSAAERNEELLRRYAQTDGKFTFWDPLYQEQAKVESIADLRREQLTVARDAALKNLGVDLQHATQEQAERLVPEHVEHAMAADIDLRNHVMVANDPELRRLAEVGPQRVIPGEGRGTIGNPQLRRYGLPDPAQTRTSIQEAEGLGRTEITGEHRPSLSPEDLPTVGGGNPRGVTPEEAERHGRDVSLRATSDADLQRFLQPSGRGAADSSNEAIARLPSAEARNAMFDAGDALRARARNLIGMQAMVPSMADSIERTVTDDVLREYGQRLGRNRGEFSAAEREAAQGQAQFLLHIAASDMQAARTEFRAARAAEAARPTDEAARDAAAGRGRQQSFPFAEERPPSIAEAQYQRAAEASTAAENLLEGDMPGQTSRTIGRLVEDMRVPPGATEAQAMAHAHEMAMQFAEQYRQLVGHAPNQREMAFAEAHLAEEAGQQWSERAQRELDTASAQREARDMQQRARDLREDEHTEGIHPLMIEPTPHEEERLDTLIQRAKDELEGEGRISSDTEAEHNANEVVDRINETHGDLAPHEEIYVRRELGQEHPDSSHVGDWVQQAVERQAQYSDAATDFEGYHGNPDLDHDDVVRMINSGETDFPSHRGDLTPWEEFHVRNELQENESYWQRRFEETLDQEREYQREQYEEDNPPESEDSEPPSSEEPASSEHEPPPSSSGPAESGKFPSRYNTEEAGVNPSHTRDPHRPDGLPDRRIMQDNNVQRVVMENTNGIKNVFGQDLDMEHVSALAPFDLMKQYADESGVSFQSGMHVKFNTVQVDGRAGEMSFSANYNKTRDGLKLYVNGLFLPSDMQGRGVVKQIIKPMVDVLQQFGCKEVSAAATEIGKFAWPALGFRPARGAEMAAVDQFGQWLQTMAGRGNPAVDKWAQSAAERTLKGTITIRDVADATIPVAGIEPKLASMKQAFENLQRKTGGNMEFEATFLDPEHENFRAGKAFLLQNHGPWNNNLKLDLDPNSAAFKQFMFRLGLLSAAGLTAGEAAKAFTEGPLSAKGVGQRSEPSDEDMQRAQATADHAMQLIDQAQKTYETAQKMNYLQGQREQLMKRTAQAMVAPPSQQRETAVPSPGITNSVGISRFLGNQSTLAAAFQEKRDALASLQRDPMALVNAMGEGYSELQDTDPAAHQKAVAQTYKIAQFLQSKMPETIGASLTRPEGTPVNPVAVRTFALYYSAATDPSSVLVDLQRNRVQKEQIDTLRQVWPDQYTELKSNLLTAMADQRPTFAQRQRMDLLFDFGASLDHSLSTRLLQAYAEYKQSPEGKKEENPGPEPGGGAPYRSRMPRRQSMPTIQGVNALASLSLGATKTAA